MLALGQWIMACFQRPPGFIAPTPRIGEADIGIAPQRQPLLLAEVAIFIAPQHRSVGMNLEIEASVVGALIDLVGWTEATDLKILEGHGESPRLSWETLVEGLSSRGAIKIRWCHHGPFHGTKWPGRSEIE
jgi:hypothetical protein